VLDTALASFRHSLDVQTQIAFTGVQTASDLLGKLAARAGVSAHELMSGYGGHEESALVADLWDCSRDRMTVEGFLDRHGYHGWREGELSHLTWREDPEPVRRQVAAYRARPDSEDPRRAEEARFGRRVELERRLLAGLPRAQRPAARAVLRMAAFYLPQRGVCKTAYLMGLDVVRAAIRRLGAGLAAAGHLDDPADVFLLTLAEARGQAPTDARVLVEQRRAIRDRYRHFEVPDAWTGMVTPTRPEADDTTSRVTGTPASPGVVEGTARVVTEAGDAEVREGEVLFARDTDPSWAALLFLSSGLVADIGGVMSHTAVVARELGIPCVVNTKVATRTVRTGDRVRVDGARGVIEVLDRAPH
jgi:rifampicin phosphotransferase